MDDNRLMYIVMAATVLLVLSIMIGFSVSLDQDKSGSDEAGGEEGSYSYHVAMVGGDPSDVFWESLYEEARTAGAKVGIYAEDFGAALNED